MGVMGLLWLQHTYRWTNQIRCNVMNLCIHYKNGTSFIKFVEYFASMHTGEYVFKWVENCIKEIREHRVLQIVTENAVVNMAAKNIMVMVRPTLIWDSVQPTQST